MGEMIRVAVDLEGVLADIHGAFLRDYNELFGTAFTREDITHWDFGTVLAHYIQVAEAFGKDADWARKEFLFGPDELYDQGFEGFLPMSAAHWKYDSREIEPLSDDLPSVFEGIREELEREYDAVEVDLVTARTNVDPQLLQDWLAYHGVEEGEHYDAFDVRYDKHKASYDVYLEDNPAIFEELGKHEYDGVLVGVDQAWNRDVFEETDYASVVDELDGREIGRTACRLLAAQ